MKTIKTITTVLIIVLNTNLFAQKLSIKAGVNMADMEISNNTGALDQLNKMKTGVHFGLFYEKASTGLFSYELGLMFDQKGFKNITESGAVTQTTLMDLYSLNLPVSLKIGFDIDENIKLFGKLGGYGGLNISGRMESEIMNSGEVESNTTNELLIGNDATQDDIKPIDFGAQVGLGIQYKSLLFEVVYDKGLANIMANQVLDDVLKNKNLKFSVGYQFGN